MHMLNLHLNNTVIQHLSENELNHPKIHLRTPDDVTHMSIHELSQTVSFSSATILRFCKKLGLSGFSELKFALRNKGKESQDRKRKNNR